MHLSVCMHTAKKNPRNSKSKEWKVWSEKCLLNPCSNNTDRFQLIYETGVDDEVEGTKQQSEIIKSNQQ